MTKWTIPADMLAAQAEADALRARVAELEAALAVAARALDLAVSDVGVVQSTLKSSADLSRLACNRARATLAANQEDKG